MSDTDRSAAPSDDSARQAGYTGRRQGRFAISLLAAALFVAGLLAILMTTGQVPERPRPSRTDDAAQPIVVDPARAAARASDNRSFAVRRARNRILDRTGHALPGAPDVATLQTRLTEHGVKLGAAVLIRIFKREHELELWLARDGRYHRFATYPICVFSGGLGPKHQTGDHQAPEGFYTVAASQLNPNSRWYRSFNLGFPNAFDRSHGRTGSALMVHGGCSSVGCYAMTNPVMGEIWQIITAALGAGQKQFQVQAYPFRMTEAALAEAANHPDAAFWQTLKTGHDLFEANQLPPAVFVCRRAYRFVKGSGRPELTPAIKTACGNGRGLAGVGR